MNDAHPDTDSRPLILVVDDERGLADLYTAWLNVRYETRVAYGGEAALEAMDGAVDVVLLDRRMPDMSGDEVLEAIRERGYDPMVGMVTAVVPDFDLLELPFDDYVTKPVSQGDVFDLVETLLNRRSYDSTVTELYAHLSTMAAVQTEKSEPELADSEAYRRLLARVEELQDRADDLIGEMDEAELAAVLRDLPECPADTGTAPDRTPGTVEGDG